MEHFKSSKELTCASLQNTNNTELDGWMDGCQGQTCPNTSPEQLFD